MGDIILSGGSAASSGSGNTGPSTGTVTSVPASTTSVTLLVANSSRKKFFIFNESSGILRIMFSTAPASLTSFSIKIGQNGVYESDQPSYTGAIQGIWTSSSGVALVTEMT